MQTQGMTDALNISKIYMHAAHAMQNLNAPVNDDHA